MSDQSKDLKELRILMGIESNRWTFAEACGCPKKTDEVEPKDGEQVIKEKEAKKEEATTPAYSDGPDRVWKNGKRYHKQADGSYKENPVQPMKTQGAKETGTGSNPQPHVDVMGQHQGKKQPDPITPVAQPGEENPSDEYKGVTQEKAGVKEVGTGKSPANGVTVMPGHEGKKTGQSGTPGKGTDGGPVGSGSNPAQGVTVMPGHEGKKTGKSGTVKSK